MFPGLLLSLPWKLPGFSMVCRRIILVFWQPHFIFREKESNCLTIQLRNMRIWSTSPSPRAVFEANTDWPCLTSRVQRETNLEKKQMKVFFTPDGDSEKKSGCTTLESRDKTRLYLVSMKECPLIEDVCLIMCSHVNVFTLPSLKHRANARSEEVAHFRALCHSFTGDGNIYK